MFRPSRCLLIAFLSGCLPVCAQSVWDGGAGTSLWSDANNWSGNTVPAASADVQFTGSSSFSVNLNGNRTARSLLFSGTSGYTLSGSTLTLSSGTLTTLSPAAGSVTHTILSNLGFSSGAVISTAASSTLVLGGTTTGTTLAKSGAGTLRIDGPASFSGGATVSAGILQVGSGSGGTFSGDIVNNANVTFFNHSLSSYAGAMSGTGSLTKGGAATLILSGSNTFSGGITIAGGNIDIGGGGSTGSITSNINSVGVTIFNRTTDYTYSGTISGSGSVYKVGANTLTLNGANDFTGSLHLEGGLLNFSSTSLGSSSNIIFHGGGLQWRSGNTLDISSRTVTVDSGGATFDTNGNNVTFANAIGDQGAGGITKAGSGTLTLSASNSYQGTTTVSGGALRISNIKAVPGDIVNNASVILASGGTFASNMSGSGSFLIGAGASIVLTGDYTLSGTTTISQGIVSLATGASMTGNIAITSAAAGTRLQFGNDLDYTYSGVISGVGAVYMTGDAKLTLSGSNTFSGGMLLASGTTAFSTSSNLGTGKITFQGGTLQWLAGNTTDISTRSVSADAFLGATLDTNGNNVTFAQTVGGGGLVTKIGSGTLTLAGGIPDAQALRINAGSVQVGNGGSLASTSASITNNSALLFNHSGTATFSGSISGSGSLTKLGSGTTTLSGAFSDTGNISLQGGMLELAGDLEGGKYAGNIATSAGTTLVYSRTTSQTLAGVISGSGALTVDSGYGILTLSGSNTYTGDTTISTGYITLTGLLGSGTYGGHIAMDGGLAYMGSSAQTFSGLITGAGTIVQSGAGTLRLTGTSNTTGGFYVSNSGGLLITSGSHVFSSLYIGLYYTGSSGAAVVSGPSTSVTTADSTSLGLGYGSTPLSGSLTITNGASYYATNNGLNIGGYNSDGSNVLVTGSGHLYATNITGNQTLSLDQGTVHFTKNAIYSVASTVLLPGGGIIDSGTYSIDTASVFSGSGSLTKTGSGTLNIVGGYNITGDTSVEGGTLKLSGTFEGGKYAGNIATSAGTTLVYSRTTSQTLAGVISGSGALTVDSGYGILTLSGTNTYTGDTTISTGYITLTGLLGSGTYAGHIAMDGGLAYMGSSAQTFSGLITGAGTIVQSGAGTLRLTGTSNTTGGFYVSNSGGLLITSGSHVFSSLYIGLYYTGSSGAAVVSGPSTTVTTADSTSLGLGYGSTPLSGSLTITNGASYYATNNGLNIGGYNSDGSNVLVSGSAHLYATSITGNQTLSLDRGTVHFTKNAVYSVASTVLLSGGGIIDSGTYSIDTATVFSGSGNLTKIGSGTLNLTATSSATGTAIASQGTLVISGSFAGNATVAAGAKLTGSGAIGGLLTVSGTIAPGNSPGTFRAGAVLLEDEGAFLFDINDATGTAGANWDLLDATGTLTIASTGDDPFIISLHSLTMSGSSGLAANFDPSVSYSWIFLEADGGIVGYEPGRFAIDSSGFLNATTGTWSIAQIGNSLAVVYTVPEPSASGLILVALALLARRRGLSRRAR